eukprot:4446473-Pyramimonas_sp.AAC.1
MGAADEPSSSASQWPPRVVWSSTRTPDFWKASSSISMSSVQSSFFSKGSLKRRPALPGTTYTSTISMWSPSPHGILQMPM